MSGYVEIRVFTVIQGVIFIIFTIYKGVISIVFTMFHAHDFDEFTIPAA